MSALPPRFLTVIATCSILENGDSPPPAVIQTGTSDIQVMGWISGLLLAGLYDVIDFSQSIKLKIYYLYLLGLEIIYS